MKLSVAFLMGSCLLVVAACLSAQASSTDDESSSSILETNKQEPVELIRVNFKLPKLFDFDRFKAIFEKRYSSLVEELARKKIFLARAFHAFITAIQYKHRKMAYYFSVNWMSDWTDEDVNRSKINTLDMGDKDELIDNSDEQSADFEDRPLPAADLEDIERELQEIERRKEDPDYRDIANELEALKRRQKREIGDTRSQLSLDDLMRSPVAQEQPEVMQKILFQGVPKNNPNYEPPELVSQGSGEDSDEFANEFQVTASNFLDQLTNNPLTNFLGKIIQDALKPKPPKTPEEEDKLVKEVRARYVLPDIDHRDDKCFFEVRNQGHCGSCYAFTAIGLYEWLYCKKTGNLVALSEQYIIDCGARSELSGCSGGNLAKTADFVGKFGLELRKNYPYRANFDQCPYETSTDPIKMGYLKLDSHEYSRIKIDYVHRYIVFGPMMIGLRLGPNFRNYGGGIDDNVDCSPDDGHGMLLVGSGSEDGKDYWIFRNSHSVAWGEKGYYRLAKGRLYECSVYRYGLMVTGSMDPKHKLVEKRQGYLEEPIKQRYEKYVRSG